VQVCTTWALTCPETVQQKPCMTREIETWLLDIVGSVTVVWLTPEADDQPSLQCVIVSTDVMSDHIGRQDASRGVECSKISVYKPIWMGMTYTGWTSAEIFLQHFDAIGWVQPAKYLCHFSNRCRKKSEGE